MSRLTYLAKGEKDGEVGGEVEGEEKAKIVVKD
jgi:hypothetical protein